MWISSLRKHPFLFVSREMAPVAKSEEKRMFSQASELEVKFENWCNMRGRRSRHLKTREAENT